MLNIFYHLVGKPQQLIKTLDPQSYLTQWEPIFSVILEWGLAYKMLGLKINFHVF